MTFRNSYSDTTRAEAYAQLEFANTYHLAFRDLPEIIQKHVKGNRGVDFGCGAGRSTRFLRALGFDAIGIDISQDMIAKAKKIDPHGDYRHVADGNYSTLPQRHFDLVQAIFTFDNIPGAEHRSMLMRNLANLLTADGCLLLLDSTPELYLNDWASFTTTCFPSNKTAGSGDLVQTIITDVFDARPVDDILWLHDDYLNNFKEAGLTLEATYYPLAKHEEPFAWINETEVAPWVIYVLKLNS
jgi:SAM-dependent methyltransferase